MNDQFTNTYDATSVIVNDLESTTSLPVSISTSLPVSINLSRAESEKTFEPQYLQAQFLLSPPHPNFSGTKNS